MTYIKIMSSLNLTLDILLPITVMLFINKYAHPKVGSL